MSDTAIAAWSTIAGALLGALIAGPVTYYYSKRLLDQSNKNALDTIHITEFNKAASEFRAVFLNDKYAIRQAIEDPKSANQGVFLMWKLHKGDIIVTFEKAKIAFEPYLSGSELEGFNDSWINYIEWMRHYMGDYDNKEKTHEMLKHLDRLLAHANPK